jgi:hypothetical protein
VAQLSEAVQAEKFELMNGQQEHERLREQIVQARAARGVFVFAAAAGAAWRRGATC